MDLYGRPETKGIVCPSFPLCPIAPICSCIVSTNADNNEKSDFVLSAPFLTCCQDYKTFFFINNALDKYVRLFVLRKTFQPSLIFVSNAGTCHCETLHDASSKLEGSLFARKYETWLKSLAQDKHSSVFVQSVVNEGRKVL